MAQHHNFIDDEIFGVDIEVFEIENFRNEREHEIRLHYYNNVVSSIKLTDEFCEIKPEYESTVYTTAAIVTEAANALPASEKIEALETFRCCKSTTKPMRIERNGQPIGSFRPNTYYCDRLMDSTGTIVECYEVPAVKTTWRDVGKPIKAKSNAELFIEEEHQFPVNVVAHYPIIKEIEKHLTCEERFNFRAAFCNVSQDTDSETEFVLIRHEQTTDSPVTSESEFDIVHDPDDKELVVERSKCTHKYYKVVWSVFFLSGLYTYNIV
jgi:hypothetical protein